VSAILWKKHETRAGRNQRRQRKRQDPIDGEGKPLHEVDDGERQLQRGAVVLGAKE
jgi:hypothetical protein